MKFALQLVGLPETQVMPAGAELTVPLPLPASVTVSVSGVMLNVAVTFCAWVMGTMQVVAVPLQPPPDHPANVAPVAGVSVSVTLVG